MTKIRADLEGLYALVGGYKMRPGPVAGYYHALRMDDGGLRAGDTVKARHLAGSPIGILTLPNGAKTNWHVEGPARDRGLSEPDLTDVVYDKGGRRVFDVTLAVDRDAEGLFVEYGKDERFRPGAVMGLEDHRMDEARLRPGDRVEVRLVGKGLARIAIPDGTKTFWHIEGPARMLLPGNEQPGELEWEVDGRTRREPSSGMAP